MTKRLATRLKEPGFVSVPGVYDMISVKIADGNTGLGFKLAIFPVLSVLAAAAALHSAYSEIRDSGSSRGWGGALYPFDRFTGLMDFERVWAFERAHAEDGPGDAPRDDTGAGGPHTER